MKRTTHESSHTTTPDAPFLLLQIRDEDDPIKRQEVSCFARALACSESQIKTVNLLARQPTSEQLEQSRAVFIGGSGNYSVATGGPWLPAALETMCELHRLAKPTFASCWGHQALARALGGEVVTDMSRAELGTITIRLTEAGRADPIFSALGETFPALEGHQDCVVGLPDDAVCLASSDKVGIQALRFIGKPIYSTQFHPELDLATFLERVAAYPEYVERIVGLPYEEFARSCVETTISSSILLRFVNQILTQSATAEHQQS